MNKVASALRRLETDKGADVRNWNSHCAPIISPAMIGGRGTAEMAGDTNGSECARSSEFLPLIAGNVALLSAGRQGKVGYMGLP